jgi:ATP-binding protein involved in chromosome partitioning
MLKELEIRNALAQVQDPELGRSIVELEMVRDLRIAEGKVSFTLALTNLSCPFKDRMVGSAKKANERSCSGYIATEPCRDGRSQGCEYGE